MLQKKFRLALGQKLYAQKTVQADLFSLKISANNLSYSRFGCIITKKVATTAVLRNSIRRRFHSCIQNYLAQIAGGYDMLFIMRKRGADVLQKTFCQDILTELKKLNLFNE
ncbi:MAG TPA: ribonuclease P protein component [Patescibacteria group bacterium]|nr:ribonuclease P protein component [Patescibacteria group bacterium]